MISKLGFLTEDDIFSLPSNGSSDSLSKFGTMTTLEKGRIIFTPQDPKEIVVWLKSGRVQVSRLDGDGDKTIISTLAPGAMFGHMSLLGQTMRGLTAEASENSTGLIVTRADLERLLAEHPQTAIRILDVLGKRLIEAESRLEDIAFKSIPARLASLLLRLSPEGKDQIYGYTHQDLAEMIGTYRETTTQTLNHFKGQGLLAIGRKRIEIRDREALERLAE